MRLQRRLGFSRNLTWIVNQFDRQRNAPPWYCVNHVRGDFCLLKYFALLWDINMGVGKTMVQ